MKFLKHLALFALCAGVFIALGGVGINIYMIRFAKPYIYTSLKELPRKYTVIVPGGRVYSTTVSHVVRDRLEAAADCVKNGKAEKVLLSGDHGRKDYDEVNRMRIFMQQVYGIDGGILFMDHAGFSTYETMYRAKAIFCVDNAVIATQGFHLARSVYIARKLGLDAVAYKAPEIAPFSRRLHASWEIRECLARIKSFFLVCFKAKPTYLGEKIPIDGEAAKSWD